MATITTNAMRARRFQAAAIALLAITTVRDVAASEIMSAQPAAASAPSPGFDALQSGSHQRPVRTVHTQGCNGHCGNQHCGYCRQGKHAKHGDCDACGGRGCPAQCPVRPGRFGFYDTQWRNWPGQGVVQAAFTEPAPPVEPPKLEVPSADEESPVMDGQFAAPEPEAAPGSESEPAIEAELLPPERAAMPAAPETPAPSLFEAQEAKEEPKKELKKEPKPDVKPEPRPARPAEENLFDEATLRRRQQERLTTLQQAAFQRERLRQEALRQQATAPAPRPAPAPQRRTAGGLRPVSHDEPVLPSDRDNPLR